MAENVGAYPVDPDTDTGKFRYASGDFNGTPITPPDPPTEAEYMYWSDVEISVYLGLANGSIPLAISFAYAGLASYWASNSLEIKTDDLGYKNTSNVANWNNLAAYWRGIAEDQGAAGDDGFDIVQTGSHGCERPPELAPWPVNGRDCGW